jgi:adenine phosphoribosyltransferase
MVDLESKVKSVIRDVPDFPVKGIVFKDITTLLTDPKLNNEVLSAFQVHAKDCNPDVVVGIDSRGFLYGNSIAMNIGVPFVPVRKEGKLPYDTVSVSYELEYGKSVLEIHKDALKPGDKVLIHDDLLATGGTAKATVRLIEDLGGVVVGFSFIINLSFLPGAKNLSKISNNLFAVTTY